MQESRLYILLSILFLFSCSRQKEQENPDTSPPKCFETQGYVVPNDSVTAPKTILAGKPLIVKVGNPKVVPTNTNIVRAGTPKIVLAGTPRICIPGKDTFSLPKTVPAINKPFLAGIPEMAIAKDAHIKDQNLGSFSSFGKLQGLKRDIISCIIQDKDGNLWFGTRGLGASKYDGKSFTYYTKKEGLSSNDILSILEDKNGNIWFGTGGGGVSKYDGKLFTHYTEQEGLSNNIVWSMLEDKNGNLWFGTYGGVSKLAVSGIEGSEKYTFTHYTTKEGLSGNIIWSILEDKDGSLWFGTHKGGVSKLSHSVVEGSDTYTFTNYTKKEGLSGNTVWSILEDKDGSLWFGTHEGGASKLSHSVVEGSDTYTFAHYTEKEGLANNTVQSMLEDTNGNIWFGTNEGGVSKLSHSVVEGSDTYTFTNYTEKEGLAGNIVLTMLLDKSDNIWLGTFGGGASKYNGEQFTHYTIKEGLPDNVIRAMLTDKNGDLWLCTEQGIVSKYDGKQFTHYTKKEELGANILAMLTDKNDNLWLGTNEGVIKYDGKLFTHYTEKEGLSNNTIYSILEDKKGNLWLGTHNGGLSKLSHSLVNGSYKQTFTNYTKKEGFSNNIVYDILEDKNNNLWLGTHLGGVYKYDGKLFTHYAEKEGFSNNSVYRILEDKNGNLWFGTDGGVYVYNSKSFTHYSEKEGLCNNNVTSIFEDKGGNLWFGTSFGLSKLSPENKKKLLSLTINQTKNTTITNAAKGTEDKIFFKNYTYEDGFLGIGVNRGRTICEDKNGTLWIATNGRLTAYHPEGEIADTIAPTIQLTSIALFNETIDWVNLGKEKVESQNSKEEGVTLSKAEGNIALDTSFTLGNGVRVGDFEFTGISKWYSMPENLSLAYNNNYLTFNFIGITQKQSKKVKYQYKLEGIDENWSAITTRTEAPYGNLPHGTYCFKVKAMNSEGYWSNEYNYSFTIRPPWWKTWWMYSVYAISTIASVILIVWWNGKRLRERAIELEEEVDKATVVIREEKEKVELANAEISEQKKIVEEKHKEITDSINYAERIQRSFLASTELLNKNLNDYFIFFQPKDVVSGDFYWAGELSNGNFALATADSTGHGVPGAIMSILNISSLEKAVEQGYTAPSELLGQTRKTIIERLKKDGSPEGGKDGMDASLICFDFNNRKFTYAAANNPVWVVRTTNGGETTLIELKPDKMPVGKSDKDQQPFTQTEFPLEKGDIIYTLTDGFPDQFGGPKSKKFMSKQLKELLLSISFLPMQEQKLRLREVFDNWKGNMEQVDDVCLIGIRV